MIIENLERAVIFFGRMANPNFRGKFQAKFNVKKLEHRR